MAAVVQITASSSLATQAVNVWHWQIPNSSPTTEVNNCVTALDTFYEAIKANLVAGTITVSGRAKTVDQGTNIWINGTSLTTVTTGSGTAPLSGCVVASLGSNVVGGSRRGRVYLGPITDSAIQSDGRSINTGISSTWLTALTTLISTTTGGVQLVVWSRTLLTATAVVNCAINPILGTQRRRLH